MRISRVFRSLVRASLPSPRSLRLAAFSTVVFGALAGAGARSVRADVREIGFAVGHQLGQLEELTAGAYQINLNGARLHWVSTRSEQSVQEVLGRYERYCRDAPSMLGQTMMDVALAQHERALGPEALPSHWGIIREETEERGGVACFVDTKQGSASTDRPQAVLAMLTAFAQSGDLSELGHLRYAFAERGPRGTRVVTLWSEGALNPGTMFPVSGDAPGTDTAFVPRPSGSRRTVSASVEGFPAGVHIYETSEEPAHVLAAADAALRKADFEGTSVSPGKAFYVRKDGVEVILSALKLDEQRTSLSVVETGFSLATIQVQAP